MSTEKCEITSYLEKSNRRNLLLKVGAAAAGLTLIAQSNRASSNPTTDCAIVDFARDFGGVGDGVIPNDAAFNDAIEYCQNNKKVLYFSSDASGGAIYKFSDELIIDKPIDIRCDNNVKFWWSGASSGIRITSASQSYWPFHCQIDLPFLLGAAITNPGTMQISFGSIASAGRGVTIKDIFGLTLNIRNISGCGDAISIESDVRDTANHTISVFGPLDNNNRGVVVRNISSSKGIGDCKLIANTINSRKNNIYLYASSKGINNIDFQINSMYSINSSNVFVFGDGVQRSITFCNFDLGYVGYLSDGTDGTPSQKQVIIGGNATLNGESGQFDGRACNFKLRPGDIFSGGISVPGDPILIKLMGERCSITTEGLDRVSSTPIPLSLTQGEANFGGGVGAASCARRIFVSMQGTWVSKGFQEFYAYSQLLTGRLIRPIKFIAADSLIPRNFAVQIDDLSYSVNRQIRITVHNLTTNVYTSQKIYGWIEID